MTIDCADSFLVDTLDRAAEPPSAGQLPPTYAESFAIIDQFSHDARGPLGVVKESAALLREELLGGLNAEQCEAARVVWERADDIHMLLDALQACASLDTRSRKPMKTACSLDLIVRDVTDRFWERASLRGVQLEVQLPSPVSVICCDRNIVRLILELLCWQAVKAASGNGSVQLNATLRTEEQQVRICISRPGLCVQRRDVTGVLAQLRHAPRQVSCGSIDFALGVAGDLARLAEGTLCLSEGTTASGFELRLPLAKNGESHEQENRS